MSLATKRVRKTSKKTHATVKKQWTSFETVLKKELKNKTFRKTYNEELARLRLAETVRESRLSRNMTQAAVAQKIDMPQSVIARLESGTHSVSVDTLSKIAVALGKQVELV